MSKQRAPFVQKRVAQGRRGLCAVVLLHFILRCRQRARRHAARAPATFDAKVKPGEQSATRARWWAAAAALEVGEGVGLVGGRGRGGGRRRARRTRASRRSRGGARSSLLCCAPRRIQIVALVAIELQTGSGLVFLNGRSTLVTAGGSCASCCNNTNL